jgi:hypothetical protein
MVSCDGATTLNGWLMCDGGDRESGDEHSHQSGGPAISRPAQKRLPHMGGKLVLPNVP